MAKSDRIHGDSGPKEGGDSRHPLDSCESMLFAGERDDLPLADLDLSSAGFADEAIPDADRLVSQDKTIASGSSSLESSVQTRSAGISNIPRKRLVLVGAGHAHLQVVNWWGRNPIPRVDLTLVSAFDRAAYSGMLPGTLAGLYEPDEMLIDLPRLCARRGVHLIVDRANSLDPVTREIEFSHQPTFRFDLASINIGSVPTAEEVWQSHRVMVAVKPLSTFLDRFRARFHELVEQWHRAPGPEMLQIIVVGGGAGGVELAFCLEQHRSDLKLPIDVRIVDGGAEILAGFPRSTIERVHRLLSERGIRRSLGLRVIGCDDSGPTSLILADDTRIRADLVIWATGAAPPMALGGFRLPKSPRGFLRVRPTLQSESNVPVFAVGDVADMRDHPIPKSGVYAVRQASVLNENLRRWFSDRPLIEYRPQRSALSILACGDGTGVLTYHGFSIHSSWAWWLKKRIDRKWVRQFHDG